MKSYECAIIVAPGLSPESLRESAARYADVITSNGGTVIKLDEWGKRNLAYEIEHHREGYYYFYKFRGGAGVLQELNRQLRIDENVLRHMIVRDDYSHEPEPSPEKEKAVSVGDAGKEGM